MRPICSTTGVDVRPRPAVSVGCAGILVAALVACDGGSRPTGDAGVDAAGPVAQPCRRDHDEDADGEPERTAHLTWEAGRKVREVVRTPGEEMPEEITEWSYDDAGRETERRVDIHGDEEFDRITTWEYDDQGRKSRRETDGGSGNNRPDGEPEEVVTWSYDEGGRRVRKEVDDGADGEVDQVVITDKNDAGRRVERTIDGGETVGAPDGEPETRITWRWGSGRLVRRERDSNPGESGGERVTTWEYEGGRRSRELIDVEADGEVDQVKRWTYDDQGRRTRRELDRNRDGEPERVVEWQYGCGGRGD